MTFKKGDKKPENSGRKKGTKNKANLGVAEFLQRRNINCIDELLKIANETKEENIKLSVYKELLSYIYPKRKAIELNQEIQLPEINIKGI